MWWKDIWGLGCGEHFSGTPLHFEVLWVRTPVCPWGFCNLCNELRFWELPGSYGGISWAMPTVFSSEVEIACHRCLPSIAVTKRTCFDYVSQSQYILKGRQGGNSDSAGALRVGTDTETVWKCCLVAYSTYFSFSFLTFFFILCVFHIIHLDPIHLLVPLYLPSALIPSIKIKFKKRGKKVLSWKL